MTTQDRFSAGRNIAMKVPPHRYEATIRFYRDALGLKEIEAHAPAAGFELGSNNLWIDCVPGMSQAQLWLQIVIDDVSAAADALQLASVVRCDDIEPLPSGFQAFWISSPAAIVHLVCKDSESGSRSR